jgi:ABC-2 type transport system ATP-binding protein
VIELSSLSKWYGEVIALNDVTTSIGRGITGLLGPNGAGKSTLMGLATGQLHPSKGAIRVFGADPWNNPAALSRIGFCPEGDPFWWNLTGWQFVTFLAKASGLGAGAKKAATEAIDRVGMSEHRHRRIRGYSKGMRQRIKIAQSLAHRPKLLILDEPFTGTDPVVRHELANVFLQLAADGVDILVSTHILHEVEALTKQILLIDHGRIVAEGDIRGVRGRMLDRPYSILVRLREPRPLAAMLSSIPTVTGLKMSGAETLVVETTAPDELYERLPEFLLESRSELTEITPADESLEAVFGYLTDRGAGFRSENL